MPPLCPSPHCITPGEVHAPRVSHCPCRPAQWLFLKPMHPEGSLDHNYYGPMPAACMAPRIVTICAIYKKGIFLVILCCRITQPLAHYPGPKIDPLDTLGVWAKFRGRPFPGCGCAVLHTRTHKAGSFVARGSNNQKASKTVVVNAC